MPVRFLGGGGGGGGSADVRGTLPLPTLNTVASLAGENVLTSWQIPANYLEAADCVYFNTTATTSGTGGFRASIPVINVRIGTTGTISDPLLFRILNDTNNSAFKTPDYFIIEGIVNINNIGTSGFCYGGSLMDTGGNINAGAVYLWGNSYVDAYSSVSINTTLPLYLTVTCSFGASAFAGAVAKTGFISMSL